MSRSLPPAPPRGLPADAEEIITAAEVQAGFDRTSLTRIQVLRAKGDTRAAINELTRLLERSPDQVHARQLLFTDAPSCRIWKALTQTSF